MASSPPDWSTVVPRETLLHAFSFLGTPRDLGVCACVCRSFGHISREPELWQAMALKKYGPVCANLGHALYGGDYWQALVRDDNQYAALPTVHWNQACYWKLNSNERYYSCFVTQIKWNRVTEQVLIYLDARGESDLRDPAASTVGFARSGPTLAGQWFPEVSAVGRFKGYLMFTQAVYQNYFTERPDGESVTFCYANRNHIWGDYESIEFPSWEQINTSPNYTTTESPFAADTDESERARWRPLIPDEVLQRPPAADPNRVVVLQRRPDDDQNPVVVLQRRSGTDRLRTRRPTVL